MGTNTGVLVTGADGQIGRALRASLPGARFASRRDVDVTDHEAISAAASGIAAIIHLAAMTDVDRCEIEPELARRVNDVGTANVTRAATEAGARVVYLSTDYVFDGTKQGEYTEEDAPSPLNAYGRSKLEGERHVLGSDDNLVVRSSWIVGEGRNFVRSILAATADRDRLLVVADQRGRPTFAAALANALVFCLEQSITGLVHVSGDGPPTTWADFAEEVIARKGLSTDVERVTSEQYAHAASRVVAPRPKNSLLSLERARRLGIPLQDWRTGLDVYLGVE